MRLSEIVVLNEDQTIPQLHQHIQQGFPNTKRRQHVTHEVRVTGIQYTPMLQNGILRINSSTTSNNGNAHTQALDIRDINFQPENSGNNVTIQDNSGRSHSVTPAKLNVSTVAVYCDCEDYQMRFANFNIQNNCHLGPPPPRYIRKTTTRPPANPNQVPGMCKHIIKVTDELKQLGILEQ